MKKQFLAVALAAFAVLTTSCGGGQTNGISRGNESKLDSLSYALGANIGYSMLSQMSDIPFDYKSISKGVDQAAFDKSSITHEQAIETLQDYFMSKRNIRRGEIEAARDTADSIAIAGGADANQVAELRAALKADADMFTSEEEREELSYAFGVDLGTNIKSAGLPLQTIWVTRAMADVAEDKALMTNTESMAYLDVYFTETRPAELAAASAVEMAKIEKQKGVVKTESGLLYRIEREGEALQATNDKDVVKVFYTGKLVRTGDVFDTNRFADRTPEQQDLAKMRNPEAEIADEPIEFSLDSVIAGWTEGMKLVGKGGRISLWIPAELAYGERGAGRAVGPNEALYFDVELVDVTPTTLTE